MEDVEREKILKFVKEKNSGDILSGEVDQEYLDLSQVKTDDEGLDNLFNEIVVKGNSPIVSPYVSNLEYFLDKNVENLNKEARSQKKDEMNDKTRVLLVAKLKKGKKVLEVVKALGQGQSKKEKDMMKSWTLDMSLQKIDLYIKFFEKELKKFE